jgi:hypothetical protein
VCVVSVVPRWCASEHASPARLTRTAPSRRSPCPAARACQPQPPPRIRRGVGCGSLFVVLPTQVSLKLQKRLAASVLGCGKRKIWLDPTEINEISMANSRARSPSPVPRRQPPHRRRCLCCCRACRRALGGRGELLVLGFRRRGARERAPGHYASAKRHRGGVSTTAAAGACGAGLLWALPQCCAGAARGLRRTGPGGLGAGGRQQPGLRAADATGRAIADALGS